MENKPQPGFRFISKIAASRFVTPAAVATALVLRDRRGAARMAFGTLVAAAASQALKRLVPRPRPKLETKHPMRSFPSGHTATAVPFVFGLASIAKNPALACVGYVAASGAALAVGTARLQEREHHLSDVIAGAAIGFAALALAHAATRTSSWRRFARDC